MAVTINGTTGVTFPAGGLGNPASSVVGLTDTQTLTNKKLTSPVISSITNTGTLTLPTSTDTLVGRATTDTLTNKTLTSPTLTTPNVNSAQVDTVSGTAPLYMARAWVNFNGTGTVAIRASGNVSSITDNGTGDYTVNFTTAMPDANYSVNTASGASSLRRIINNYGVDGAGTAVPPTTSTIRVICFDESIPGTVDVASVSVAIFR